MSDFTLSLFAMVVKAIVKELVSALVKYTVSRKKGRTAPIHSRDGSDD